MEKRKRPTTIEGLSDRFRLPRMGKIRLGIKKKSEKSGKEYPSAVDYFVCPPEVIAVYGDNPRDLKPLMNVLKLMLRAHGLKCVSIREGT